MDSEKIEYCLYARKSSEDDERQAMSIDSQIKEMNNIALRDSLFIKEVRRESHSAKMSGQRPVFSQLLKDISKGLFTGVLTWAPDRLSRNAGDLGILVDLMDAGKLKQIKTFSQNFSNNPNEKFLLMILCSQAKLENDNRAINVKRGIRAKCEMGWRPGLPPIGYFNRTMAGLRDILIDPKREKEIKEMFERASKGESGRTIKKWFDRIGMTTRAGKQVSLSQIYHMLKNPFYYGRFEYPIGTNNWYQGKHAPLVSKKLFDKVQEQLTTSPKSGWGKKIIIFKGLFKCGGCGSNIIGEEKFRKRKFGLPSRRHVYYHCARQLGNCREPYISEDKLIKQILRYINFMNMAHPNFLKLTEVLKSSIASYQLIRDEVLYEQDISPNSNPLDSINFARYILTNGTIQEKRDLVKALDRQLFIKNRFITS